MAILNLYMGGGGELTDFPPAIHVFTDVFTDASTPVGVYAHLLSFSFFSCFLGDILCASFDPKLRFPLVFSGTV